MALVATANLALVLFDLTYVPLRNFWLLGNVRIPLTNAAIPIPLPPPAFCTPPGGVVPDRATLVTQCYDWIKGIEPHRDTYSYLNLLNEHEQLVRSRGLGTLRSPEVLTSLRELGQLSNEMITTNPFEAVGKSGTLERIKNLMRDRMRNQLATLPPEVLRDPFLTTGASGPAPRSTASPAPPEPRNRVSAQTAFRVFWSPVHLTPATWEGELRWFDQAIRPLIQTNYYRSISETGAFTNNFWLLDAPFVALFLLEFLARTLYFSRRYTGVSWLDAMVWRWYDVLLFFPFGVLFPGWAWLRAIAVAIRLHQSRLINLERILHQASQSFVGSIGEEVTEVVVIQVLNQLQGAIRRGEISQWLLQTNRQQWVGVNNVDEVTTIANLFFKLVVYQVFPKIQPDLEALLRQSLDAALSQSPAYQTFKSLPGVGTVPGQLTERLVTELTQAMHQTLVALLEDPGSSELTQRLIENFRKTLGSEVQDQDVLKELQSLINDLIEELKINYVRNASGIDVEMILEETRKLEQRAKIPPGR